MPETTERFELRPDHLIERFKQLVHEGNVRRVTIKQGETTIAVFPLTAGVVGAVIAPALAAIGALAAMLSECTIEGNARASPRRRVRQSPGVRHPLKLRRCSVGDRVGPAAAL